jgi:hypothetical protein
MAGYDKQRLEAYVDLWFIGRAVGRTLTELLGIEQCEDSCPLHSERWELVDGPWGKRFRCSVCHRFIGYPPIEKRRSGL